MPTKCARHAGGSPSASVGSYASRFATPVGVHARPRCGAPGLLHYVSLLTLIRPRWVEDFGCKLDTYSASTRECSDTASGHRCGPDDGTGATRLS